MPNLRVLGNIFDPKILAGEQSGTFRDSAQPPPKVPMVEQAAVEGGLDCRHALAWTLDKPDPGQPSGKILQDTMQCHLEWPVL